QATRLRQESRRRRRWGLHQLPDGRGAVRRVRRRRRRGSEGRAAELRERAVLRGLPPHRRDGLARTDDARLRSHEARRAGRSAHGVASLRGGAAAPRRRGRFGLQPRWLPDANDLDRPGARPSHHPGAGECRVPPLRERPPEHVRRRTPRARREDAAPRATGRLSRRPDHRGRGLRRELRERLRLRRAARAGAPRPRAGAAPRGHRPRRSHHPLHSADPRLPTFERHLGLAAAARERANEETRAQRGHRDARARRSLALARHGAARRADPPAPSSAGDGEVFRVGARDEVPLTGPRVDARAGDWRLESAGQVAVVDARGGRTVDFRTAGRDDALVGVEPTLYVGLDDVRTEVVAVAPVPEAPRVVRIERRAHDVPLTLWTFVSFVGPTLRIESVATSSGDADAGTATLGVTVGERVAWGNVPTCVEGTGFVSRGGTYSGEFIAREGLGEAYALGLDAGRLVARFNAPEPGFHERAHTGEEALQLRAGEASRPRTLWLAHADGALGDAVTALERAKGVALVPLKLPAVAAERAVAEIASCAPDSLDAGTSTGVSASARPFERFLLGASPRDALVTKGCLRIRATAPGYAPGAWTAGDEATSLAPPRAGRLHWHVTERGASTLPARLIVRGVPPTPDPDWGDEPHDGAALEAIVSLGEGDVPIPAGTYRVILSRGFEYTTSEQTIHVDEGRATSIEATLERVVDTRGWISADLHVHALPSPDAPTLLEDRVRSLAASGVEVAAA